MNIPAISRRRGRWPGPSHAYSEAISGRLSDQPTSTTPALRIRRCHAQSAAISAAESAHPHAASTVTSAMCS
jgi:hypothetical protein